MYRKYFKPCFYKVTSEIYISTNNLKYEHICCRNIFDAMGGFGLKLCYL